VKEPWLIAFSTASSEAALPRAMQAMEALGVPKRIVAFVIRPATRSTRRDDASISRWRPVFIAQAANVPMTLGQQITMMLTLMVTSKGVAAVPRASS